MRERERERERKERGSLVYKIVPSLKANAYIFVRMLEHNLNDVERSLCMIMVDWYVRNNANHHYCLTESFPVVTYTRVES